MKSATTFVLSTFLSINFLSAEGQTFDWGRAQRIAEAQHEIIEFHLKRGQYQQVPKELRKIYALRLPPKYQSILREEVDLVVKYLIDKKEYGTALTIVDEAVSNLTLNRHKVHLLKKKAYVLDKTGREAEAVECVRLIKSLKSAP